MTSETTFFPCCTIVSAETTDMSYEACGACERALSGFRGGERVASWRSWACGVCQNVDLTSKSWAAIQRRKRQYKLRLGLQVEEQILIVVAFDKVARQVIGCSADEWWKCAGSFPGAASALRDLLEGIVCEVHAREKTRGAGAELRAMVINPLDESLECPYATLTKWFKCHSSFAHRAHLQAPTLQTLWPT
eukprot:TRINITY_DN26168_c0_g1_i1.p1 TRINITY_DN26168_c0_g1~~TRINITY_DN26168_c0_g1_i1.p1  ORF type:complete len:191 (+),score=12.98 TRINITY_DN26168_c0_g1_i1:745-1317(+)